MSQDKTTQLGRFRQAVKQVKALALFPEQCQEIHYHYGRRQILVTPRPRTKEHVIHELQPLIDEGIVEILPWQPPSLLDPL